MAISSRLRWRCRRGTREMDLMLTRFLDAEGDALDEDTGRSLERLLEQPDRDILDWITRPAAAPDAALAALVERIRAASTASGG